MVTASMAPGYVGLPANSCAVRSSLWFVATTQTPAQSPAVATGASSATVASSRSGAQSEYLVSGLVRSTPRRLRLVSFVAAAAVIAAGVVSFIAATQIISATNRIEESTGPVLVASQEVFAAVAEADAAATGVHLSGAAGDREQRSLFESALDRSATGVETIARLVGDDERSHEALQSINSSLATYAGQVEAARVANNAGLPDADDRLIGAIDVIRSEISPELEVLTAGAQGRLADDLDAGTNARRIAYALIFVALVILVLGQLYLASRTRRLFNIFAVLATVAVVAMGVWVYTLSTNQQRYLDEARDGGYESIALTANIQANAFRVKAGESLGLIPGAPDTAGEQAELFTSLASGEITEEEVARVRDGLGIPGNSGLLFDAAALADDDRERAAAAEMLERWRRYRATADEITALVATGDIDAAQALAAGQSNTDFNGFNTAVESVISDNRVQFENSVESADNALSWFRPVLMALTALGALLALAGFDQRIRDYR